MSKTHWKKLQHPDFFGAYCLPDGKDMNITIEQVIEKEVTNTDGKKEVCAVAVLKNQKPMILNVTNSKMLAKLSGSNFIEDWKGLTVTAYVAQVKAFGDTVDAVRFRSRLPKIEIPYDQIIDAIRSGKATIEQAVDKYPKIDVERVKKATA